MTMSSGTLNDRGFFTQWRIKAWYPAIGSVLAN
jgi:hypothetical protein